MRPRPSARYAQIALVLLVAWSLAQRADAQSRPFRFGEGPLLHEHLPPDDKEDLALASTTPSGELPAVVETSSGTIRPPDLTSRQEPRLIYDESRQAAAGTSYQPDRDTSRPQMEKYDDPFIPTLTPFKRQYAFDAVRPDYSLYVQDGQLQAVSPTAEVSGDDDRFFGDLTVLLQAEQPVRIPTVGPGTRLLKLVTVPEVGVKVFRDGADNWFAEGDRSVRVRMVTELAIARESFGGAFADVAWSALPKSPAPAQPASHQAAYRKVAAAIGLGPGMRPREVVAKMVAYFRSFSPSDDEPVNHGNIYLDLALSKKGVCRHRAFAFVVTALNAGIHARFVHNEAHAWVEVRDDKLWHRIDLGGAALDLADEPDLDRPPHVPLPDPYEWPTGRDSGADLARRQRAEAIERQASTAPGDTTSEPAPSEPAAPMPSGMGPGEPEPSLPPGEVPRESTVQIQTIDHDIFRGLPLHIRGVVRAEGRPCTQLRVDVVVIVDEVERRVGSLSTDERGVYDGAVVLPADLPIGDHELQVLTAGNETCGPGLAD